MAKCYLVQDLLPSYIDGVVSPETEADIREHLQECEVCRSLHATLSLPIKNLTPPPSETKQIDFLKKIRKKTLTKLAVGFGLLLVLFAGLTYFMAIGSPVSKKDLQYTAYVEGDEWRLNLELTNGMSLLVRTEPIYGEKNSDGIQPVVGILVNPYQLIPSPLLERGNDSFMFGSTLGSFDRDGYKVILRMDDGDIEFTADQLRGLGEPGGNGGQ